VIDRYSISALLLFLAALVQLNDPDPLPWFLVYAASSAILMARRTKKIPFKVTRMLAWGMSVVAFFWFVSIVSESWVNIEALSRNELLKNMSSEHPGNELLKELGGLLICISLLFVLVIRPNAKS